MFGVSTPTFVTPDTRANAQLQFESLKNAPIFYFLNLHRPHVLDFIMQGLWIKTQSSPFEAPYFSCVPYLLGEGQAMQYSVWPKREPQDPDPAPAAASAGRLPAQRHGHGARSGRRRARRSPAAADRSASDADRKQRGAVAGAAVAARVGGHACAFRSRNSIRRRRSRSRDASPTTRGTASPSIARSAIKVGPAAACITSCRSIGTT